MNKRKWKKYGAIDMFKPIGMPTEEWRARNKFMESFNEQIL